MPNPLLNNNTRPTFTTINPKKHIESAIETLLATYRSTLATCLQQTEFTWHTLLAPLNAVDVQLEQVWSTVLILNDHVQTDEIREIHARCEARIQAFQLEQLQNPAFFAAVQAIAEGADFARLTVAEQRDVKAKLQAFACAGIDLPPAEQQELIAIEKALSEAQTTFKNNLLDHTNNSSCTLTNPLNLAGLPESYRETAAAEAKAHGKTGWRLTLDTPLILASLKSLNNRDLRQTLYHGYYTRASDANPEAAQWNNLPLIETILHLRHRKAQLLGYPNYAAFMLAGQMAKTPETVMDFLLTLANKTVGAAKREMAALQALAKQDGVTDFQPWDIAYYAEKLRIQKYHFLEEEIKPYFPLDHVLRGYFTVLNTLYGITIQEAKADDVWHPDVRYFEIVDADKQLRGNLYMDLYTRPRKREGAWMQTAGARVRLTSGELRLPIACLSADFVKPTDEKPSLLSLRDVETLFHEGGHCLHHLLTTMEVKSVSGIFGVPDDGIELPSQMMEHFVYDPAVLRLITAHYKTGDSLPATLLERITAARQFQTAMSTLQHVQQELLDMRLHLEYDPEQGAQVSQVLTEIQQYYMPLDHTHFPCQFIHVFAGDYAATYYGYHWAEVLACDAYSRFEAEGTLSAAVGRDFLQCILEQGGALDFMEAFRQFRGREPRIEAFMHYKGLDVLPGLSEGTSLFRKRKMLAPLACENTEEKAVNDPAKSPFSR